MILQLLLLLLLLLILILIHTRVRRPIAASCFACLALALALATGVLGTEGTPFNAGYLRLWWSGRSPWVWGGCVGAVMGGVGGAEGARPLPPFLYFFTLNIVT